MAPPTRPKRKKESDYEETPDYGTVFQRADNQPPRPGFTGQGVLSQETLDAIIAADGAVQLSVWTLDRDGKPLRNRDGTRRFRLHIEAPYEDGDQEEEQDTRSNGRRSSKAAEDDIPF